MYNNGGQYIGQYGARPTTPLQDFLHQKWVRIVLIIDILVAVVIIGTAIHNAQKTAIITFNVAPTDATISMGGTTYENGTYKIHPGSYDITISHEGLTTKTLSINVDANSSALISTFLSAKDSDSDTTTPLDTSSDTTTSLDTSSDTTTISTSAFAFYELKANYDSFLKLAEIASSGNNQTIDYDTTAEEFITAMNKILSIYDVLPIKDYLYQIPEEKTSTAGFAIKDGKDEEDCEKTACLLVNYYGADYEDAVIADIKKAGYTPADYQIIYKRYE